MARAIASTGTFEQYIFTVEKNCNFVIFVKNKSESELVLKLETFMSFYSKMFLLFLED